MTGTDGVQLPGSENVCIIAKQLARIIQYLLMRFIPILAVVCLVMCQGTTVRESQPETTALPGGDSISIDMQESPARPFTVAFLMGHFNPQEHPDFVLIDTQHADRGGMYLHKDTYAAFVTMYKDALRDGIRLQIRSATRNFSSQKSIWERKWTGETTIENGKDASVAYPDAATRAAMILRYSAMPGTSRHHWGTDIDLNAFDNSWFESGAGLQIYTWLAEHAHRYGFCQPYSAKGELRPGGYEEERWHWSYLPLSRMLTQMAADSLRDAMISGFQGAEVARQLRVVERYVLGINPQCR